MAAQGRKRISSLLLLIVAVHILLPVLLSLATVVIKVSQQRIIAGHNGNPSEFVHFQLSDVAGTISDDKEFYYEGTMYDVKSVEAEHGKYVVYALPDRKETTLHKVKESAGDTTAHNVLPFVFLFHESPPVFSILVHSTVSTQAGHYTRSETEGCIAMQSPPPWCATV